MDTQISQDELFQIVGKLYIEYKTLTTKMEGSFNARIASLQHQIEQEKQRSLELERRLAEIDG